MIKILSLLFTLLFSTFAYSGKLLIVGDSLSAGYNMSIKQSWPYLLNKRLTQQKNSITVINASISGDTTANGLARLPTLLRRHQPTAVLIELGANDGLRGFRPQSIFTNITEMISLIQANKAQPILMQIEIPTNYGKRYTQAFSEIYPQLSEKYKLPLIPFFLESIVRENPQWIMKDGLHPKAQAQPWIAEFMAKQLVPYLD